MAGGLGSIAGTLQGLDPLTLAQALAAQQQQELAQNTAAATEAANQASQQYQTAAQAPAPQLDPFSQLIPALFGNVASVLSQNPVYSERGQQEVQQSRAELLKARADNLAGLMRTAQARAEIAQKAGDFEAEQKARTTLDSIHQKYDMVKQNADHAFQAEQNRLDRENRLAVAQGTAQEKKDMMAAKNIMLSPEGLDMAAFNYRQTGQMPPLGFGNPAMRKQIIERAASLPPDYVPGVNLPANRAEYATNAFSLKRLQSQADALNAFERTGLRNLDLVITKAKAIPDAGAPWANRPMRNASLKGLGSEEVAAFRAAQGVAAPEIARILNNPNLGGQLTDSARHEAEQLLSKDYTFNQLVAVSETLKQDFANRKQSYAEQINEIQGRMRGTPQTAEPTVTTVSYKGKSYHFPDPKAAETFKKRLGIK